MNTVLFGDCREVLATLDNESIDSIVTDPPYELGFMGKKWDSSGIAYDPVVWEQCFRVLKPGGHLLAFGGTRTYHRMTVAIEDAGFQIRDSIHWIYGSGFPKSLNLKDEWSGWGTALKPAHEPIVLARKPLDGTVAANVLQWGTGAINVDGARVGSSAGWSYPNGAGGNTFHGQSRRTEPEVSTAGRWPANIVFTHAAYCGDQCAEGCPVAALDQQSGVSRSVGASRFFTVTEWDVPFRYIAKPSKRERNAGLDGQNHHPTVKPLALMRWLVRLVTPPNGTVLDPFAGSGTTLIAAILEGFQYVGIENTKEYVPIINSRISHAEKNRDKND